MTDDAGTFACPICGKDTPHYHSPEEVEQHRETEAWAEESWRQARPLFFPAATPAASSDERDGAGMLAAADWLDSNGFSLAAMALTRHFRAALAASRPTDAGAGEREKIAKVVHAYSSHADLDWNDLSAVEYARGEGHDCSKAHYLQAADDILALATPKPPADEANNGWQPIATCSTWKHDHMHTMLANWTGRGVCETYWDEDEDYDHRPKGWVSPREGWRSPGDMCIPVDQGSVTDWMPKPAPPARNLTGDGAGA